MKKILIIIGIMILAACSMSPGPTDQQLRQEFGMSTESVSELRPALSQDTTRKERKEIEQKELMDTNKAQQNEVLKKIDKLKEHQVKMDSILNKKKNGGN